jgi:hypothetical protein
MHSTVPLLLAVVKVLLQRSVHIQLLPVPPPPLNGVRPHLDARPDAPALASPGGEDL